MNTKNLKFTEFEYVRPDFEKLISGINDLTASLKEAKSVEAAIKTYESLIEITQESDSMVTLAYIEIQ